MKLIFKYWSEKNNIPCTTIPCECKDIKDLKATANRLLLERTDIDNLVVYMGSNQVACWHNR